MGNHLYKRKIPETCKLLKIHSSKINHTERNTAPAIMDMAEVDRVDQQNIGNFSNDVFSNRYSTKLPLGAMHTLAGVDKRMGCYRKPKDNIQG